MLLCSVAAFVSSIIHACVREEERKRKTDGETDTLAGGEDEEEGNAEIDDGPHEPRLSTTRCVVV